MTRRGIFDILTFKGVNQETQGLFSNHAKQDEQGQIHFDFFDGNGNVIDREVLSLYRNKRASFGISFLGITETTRSVFISDSYASLIFFANQFKGRIALEEAGFVVVGAEFDERLLKKVFDKIPAKAKINTVFSSSILGRVMDCKVQNLIQCRKCAFKLNWELIHFESKKKTSTEPIHLFSLRTYCISQGVKQTVRTFKPKRKGIESFYKLNQQTRDVFK